MTRFRLLSLLLALCLLLALFGCQKSGQGDEKPATAADVTLSLPTDVYYISISLLDAEGGGYAPIPSEQIGVIRQLTDETNGSVLTPLPTITDKTFDFENCFDVCFYTQTTSRTVSVDINGLIYTGNRTYTLREGVFTYDYVAGYYNAFRTAE